MDPGVGAPPRQCRLTQMIAARRARYLLAIVAVLAVVAPMKKPDHTTAAVPPMTALESVELLSSFANWPGECRVLMPGIHSTRRVKTDPITQEPVEVELALAVPLVVEGYAAWGTRPPKIALTFDDGPDARYTPQLLDILAENNARATFFVLGALVDRHAKLVRRMEKERHEIGIHSWWHADFTKIPSEEIADDLKRCQVALDAVVERPIRWVRPPYGALNSRVESVIDASGYRIALWTVDPHDWKSPGSGVIASRVLNRAHDGAIVLLHDGGGNRSGTVEAMRQVVPRLKARGFELVTVSELTGLSEPPPIDRGMQLTIGDEQFEIKAGYDEVRVEVDGVDISLGTAPLMVRDQFVIPARPVLEALGAEIGWDEELFAVTFRTVRGEFVVKLNSLDVKRNDRAMFVQLPSVSYRGTAMIPAWLIANACRANVTFDSERRVIEYTSPAR